jgi:hypothetical protein
MRTGLYRSEVIESGVTKRGNKLSRHIVSL